MSHPPVDLTREDLYRQVWAEPIVHVAKRLGLSGRGLGKVCARHAIPVPPRGWWARKRHGKAVRQTSLKSDSAVGQVVIWGPGPAALATVVQPELDRESDPAWRITVPEGLAITHRLVRATGAQIRRGWRERRSITVGPDRPAEAPGRPVPVQILRTTVSRSVLPRALRIWQALLAAFERRGYPVTFDKNGETVVSVLEEPFEIALIERQKQVFVQRTWGRRMELEPSGRLFLRVGGSYSNSGTVDKPPHVVEERLNRFVAGLVRRALEIKRQRAAQEERERRWQVHDDQRRHKQQERDTERLRVRRLRTLAVHWSRDRRLAEFLDDVKRCVDQDPDVNRRETAATWLTWAHEHLHRRDSVAKFLREPWPTAPLPPSDGMPWSWE